MVAVKALLLFAVLVVAFGTAVTACDVHGVFADVSGEYNITCIDDTEVHIEYVPSTAVPWAPLNASYDPSTGTIKATFSNCLLYTSPSPRDRG